MITGLVFLPRQRRHSAGQRGYKGRQQHQVPQPSSLDFLGMLAKRAGPEFVRIFTQKPQQANPPIRIGIDRRRNDITLRSWRALVLPALLAAAEHIAIEAPHRLGVDGEGGDVLTGEGGVMGGGEGDALGAVVVASCEAEMLLEIESNGNARHGAGFSRPGPSAPAPSAPAGGSSGSCHGRPGSGWR